MNPYDEQRLRDEVIYLHSLWHQGPPRSNSSNDLRHGVSNRTRFTRGRAKSTSQRGNRNNRNQDSGKEWPCNPTSKNVAATSLWPTRTAQSNSQLSWHSGESSKEWPCNRSCDTSTETSAWPAFSAQQNLKPILLSPEEQARLAARRAQARALKAIKDFFRSNNTDEDDEEEDEDLGGDDHDDNEGEEDEDHDDLNEEEYGVEQYRFFMKVFEDDSELRKYYEKNYQNGDFSCLVCCGVGIKKASKRFKDCVALIQHSVSIAKTKKRRAHRAYGKAICKVLGWDIHKLPTIVSALSAANHDVNLSNSDTSQGEVQGNVVDESKDNSNVLGDSEAQGDIGNSDELQEKESNGNENLPSNDEWIVSQENSLIAADTSKFDEVPNLTTPNTVEDEGSGQPSDVENSLIAAETSKFDEDPKLTAPNIVEDGESGQPSDVR